MDDINEIPISEILDASLNSKSETHEMPLSLKSETHKVPLYSSNETPFIEDCNEIVKKSPILISSSEFAPDNFDASELMKEMLNEILGSIYIGNRYKLSLSGNIIDNAKKADSQKAESQKEQTVKKQSFCSEFKYMINNIVALLGFEYSNFLMTHKGMFYYIYEIINELKNTKTYEDILTNVNMLYNIFCNNGITWELITDMIVDDKKKVGKTVFNINGSIPSKQNSIKDDVFHYTDKNVIITNFFMNMISKIKTYSDVDVSDFIKNKNEIIESIEKFIKCINYGVKNIDTVDELCINLGTKYSILYDGSFIKIYEILFKASYVDTTLQYKMENIKNFDYQERYVDSLLHDNEKTSSYYISSFEHYFSDIYKRTINSLNSEENNELRLKFDKIQLHVSNTLNLYLSKILLNILIILSKTIASYVISLELNGKTTRIQFSQVLTALITINNFVLDFKYRDSKVITSDCQVEYTKSQLRILYYILLTNKNLK